LGVASIWEERKGIQDFIKLSTMLDDSYSIVMVGVSEKQRKALPANILALPRTNNARELAEIYTAADVFFNPTYEDNYPTVNLEAQACGTPVITYRTGGAPETITDPRSVVAEQGDFENITAMI
jgi:glycosyltransferase involved in cell wall biosynthesis